jgi:hypothetical protein
VGELGRAIDVNDWIDNEKAAEEAQTEDRRLNGQLRLHKAKLISAKVPGFWTACLERLRSICEKLRVVYPNDLSKQCSLGNDGAVWTLQGCKTPWKILQMQLNVIGQSVDIFEGRKESRDRTAPVGPDQISIKVNEDDEIEFYFRGARYLTPDSMAEGLAKYVRG